MQMASSVPALDLRATAVSFAAARGVGAEDTPRSMLIRRTATHY
jgi:hypothetical protein